MLEQMQALAQAWKEAEKRRAAREGGAWLLASEAMRVGRAWEGALGGDVFGDHVAGGRERVVVREDETIDAVCLWVNGSDAEYMAVRSEAMGAGVDTNAVAAARVWAGNDELRYALRSVWKAAWAKIGRVFIVTYGGRRPSWLADGGGDGRVVVVDEATLFPPHLAAEALPTFNTNALMAVVDRIPGLSENFVLLTDDIFVAGQVDGGRVGPLVDADGRPVFHSYGYYDGCFDAHSCSVVNANAALDTALGLAVDNASDEAWRRKVHWPGRRTSLNHAPLILNVALLRALARVVPDAWTATVTSRFRARTDVNIQQLYAFAVMEAGWAPPPHVVDKYGRDPYVLSVSAKGDFDGSAHHICALVDDRPLRNRSWPVFVNVNDADRNQPCLARFHAALFPHPAPWERRAHHSDSGRPPVHSVSSTGGGGGGAARVRERRAEADGGGAGATASRP